MIFGVRRKLFTMATPDSDVVFDESDELLKWVRVCTVVRR
jgi:hypothetical protein